MFVEREGRLDKLVKRIRKTRFTQNLAKVKSRLETPAWNTNESDIIVYTLWSKDMRNKVYTRAVR